MDQCSQTLNRGAQPMPSAVNSLSIPALSLDSRDAGICAPAPAYQIHTESRLPFVRFAWKTASSVRKAFSSVRLCPFRAINKLKTNTLWERLYADCPSKERAPLKIARISKPTPPPPPFSPSLWRASEASGRGSALRVDGFGAQSCAICAFIVNFIVESPFPFGCFGEGPGMG